jgi:hypothetical protein
LPTVSPHLLAVKRDLPAASQVLPAVSQVLLAINQVLLAINQVLLAINQALLAVGQDLLTWLAVIAGEISVARLSMALGEGGALVGFTAISPWFRSRRR